MKKFYNNLNKISQGNKINLVWHTMGDTTGNHACKW